MKIGQFGALILASAAVAAGVSLMLAPKLEQRAETVPTAATLRPATPSKEEEAVDVSSSRSAVISIREDGHYWARALTNHKASVDFMVDTGASTVALTFDDARKMGLRPETLEYKWRIRTAGGDTQGASVLIKSIKIGQVEIRDVEGMVIREDLDQSLLGMSFLRELYSYEFRGERLIIRQ